MFGGKNDDPIDSVWHMNISLPTFIAIPITVPCIYLVCVGASDPLPQW
jgi:hypothetical protein